MCKSANKVRNAAGVNRIVTTAGLFWGAGPGWSTPGFGSDPRERNRIRPSENPDPDLTGKKSPITLFLSIQKSTKLIYYYLIVTLVTEYQKQSSIRIFRPYPDPVSVSEHFPKTDPSKPRGHI